MKIDNIYSFGFVVDRNQSTKKDEYFPSYAKNRVEVNIQVYLDDSMKQSIFNLQQKGKLESLKLLAN